MLKSKKAIYLLIPLNAAIWGFFIYRFYVAYHESDLPQDTDTIQISPLKGIKDSTTYHLALNYKDPFLKETTRSYHTPSAPSGNAPATTSVRQQVTAAPVPVKTVVNVIPKQAPEIKYLGLIKNTSNGTVTALVSINGQSHLIKPNESIEGYIFKTFSRDSLVASRAGERIVVTK